MLESALFFLGRNVILNIVLDFKLAFTTYRSRCSKQNAVIAFDLYSGPSKMLLSTCSVEGKHIWGCKL